MKSASGRSADYANVLQTLIKSVRLLQEATESTNLPLPSGPLAGVAIDRLETIKTLKANQDVGEELAEKIVHQVATIYHELARPATNESDAPNLTRSSVTRYTKALTDAQDTLIRLSQRGRLGQSLLRGKDRKELINVMSKVDKEFNSFMETLGREQNPAREHRRSLHITPAALQDFGVPGGSGRPSSPLSTNEVSFLGQQQQQQQSYCWPGTRIPILDEIDLWATTTASHATPGSSVNTSLIYWLADIPGSGKSAIASSLVEEWRVKGILGGYYDFGTSNAIHVPGETGDELVPGLGDITDALCEAWAIQLGAAYPELSSVIHRELSDIHRSSSARRFSNQLKQLILNPLKTLQRARYDLQPHTKILFVLDSIDECPPPHRAAILQAIKSVNAAHGGVKFFLISGLPTSEADNDIATELLESPPSLVTRGSINIHSASNMADILLYLTSQFQVHAAQFYNHSQFRTALIEPTIRVLAKRAEGLILWAKLAFEMLLMAENPTRMLLNLVEEDALSDVRGLYLELMLTAQSNLDVLNELRAPSVPKEDIIGNRSEESPTSTGISIPVGTASRLPEAFPKNALALVVSAVGYATELLSVSAIAELTGLGLERTAVILDLLSIVLDHSTSPTGTASQPHVALASSSRVNLATSGNAMPIPPLKPRKRSVSTPRNSSFSPPRRKSRPLSSHVMAKFPHSPMTPNFSAIPENSKRLSLDMGSQNGQDSTTPSSNRSLLAPSNGDGNTTLAVPFPSVARGSASGRTVRIRHVTFREWIQLRHPPTLLSCLTGKGSAEEDDLRFLVAPSREGAHAMLAKGCFGIIRTTNLTPRQMEDRDQGATIEGGSEDGVGRNQDSGDAFEDEMVSYACRYWAYHCTEMLSSLMATRQHSEIYMTISSNLGTRWKGIRGEMLEFFTRKLLWWADTSIGLNCVAQANRSLKGLRDILEDMSPEEGLKSTVDQLIQWADESIYLLGNPLGYPEEDRDLETSLVHKYYGEELERRVALAEAQRAELAELEKSQRSLSLPAATEMEMLPPVPTVPEQEDPRTSLVKTASSEHSAPSEVTDSVGNTGSAFTGTTSVSTDEGEKEVPSGDLVETLKEEKELPLTPVMEQGHSDPRQVTPTQESEPKTATGGTTTPTVHPVVSSGTKVLPAPPAVSIKSKDLPAPPPPETQHSSASTPRDEDAESNNEPTIRPPQKPSPVPPAQNRSYPTGGSTGLFPGLAFFQNTSQQSLVSPVSTSSEQSKRKNSSPSEPSKRKDSFPAISDQAKRPEQSNRKSSSAASTKSTGAPALPAPPAIPSSDHAKRPEPSNRKSSSAASTKSTGAPAVPTPPAIPSSDHAKRPEPSNRKSSNAASTKSTAAPKRAMPPPPPIMTAPSSSGAPRLSTGDLSPGLGDILNMINFDNLTPTSPSAPPGSSGATRGTGVN